MHLARGRWLMTTLVVAFVAIQVAVPTVGLFASRPARFSWQMYANLPRLPDVWTVGREGNESRVDILALVPGARGEIDFVPPLLHHLCAEADVVAVRVQDDGAASEVMACPP